MRLFVALVVCFVSVSAREAPRLGGRIAGGEKAEDGRYPYQASLQVLKAHLCAGAILNKRWVVTSGECLEYPATWYKVYVGSNKLDFGGWSYDVAQKIIHERFNEPPSHNDIGLLKVTIDFSFNDRVQPIPLENRFIRDDERSIIMTGWGYLQTGGNISNDLQKLEVRSVEFGKCKAFFPGIEDVGEDHLCTFTQEGEGACTGDSGTPLALNGKLVGIVNWGIPCGRGYPDVNSRISSYADWIWRRINN